MYLFIASKQKSDSKTIFVLFYFNYDSLLSL